MSMNRSLVVLLGAATLGTGTLSSRQERTSRLEFDVVSVKENKALGTGGMMRRVPGGGITATHMRATSLITFAYELQSYELVGAPEWARQTYYDVNAKPAESVTKEQTFSMLQALLADRFKLAFTARTVSWMVMP